MADDFSDDSKPYDAEKESEETIGENVMDEEQTEERSPFSALRRLLAASSSQFTKMQENLRAPLLKQQNELLAALQEYHEKVRTAVESSIKLDEPWEYDPVTSTVHARAERMATDYTLHLIEKLQEIGDPYFKSIQYRMRVGYEAYTGRVPNEEGEMVDVNPRPHEAIFVFISLQDALMHWLCEQNDSIDPDKGYEQRDVYHADTKRDELEEKYVSLHGIAPGDTFTENLGAFYHHRNYIMHGSPDAHFDMNIATASILFFILTFHTVLEERDDLEL